MKTFLFCLSVLGLMGAATCAGAAELPDADHEQCSLLAEIAYQSAVLDGDPLPDGAYESTMGECERLSMLGSEGSLNDMIAIDGEVVWPVCRFEGGCAQ